MPSRHRQLLLAVLLALFAQTIASLAAEAAPDVRAWWSTTDLPPSNLRSRLDALPAPAREQALAHLRRLQPPSADLHSIHADADGALYYIDHFPVPEETEPIEPGVATLAVPVSPFPAALRFHSRPGAPNVIFINFCGETVSNTAWNDSLNRSEIPAVAFSTDSDFSTFSDAEQKAIKQIWQRVSEDYAAFDIDVTTERPAVFGNRTAHALVTRNTDANGQANPASTSAGVAYVDVFGSISYARYRPAWIYFNQLANNESYIAEAVSHELGHNFGLSHDGKTDGTEYYAGHGSGDTSWGPIMGLSYNRSVSQWSKGEYYLANNTQDDLAIISSKATYRTDDFPGSFSTATPLRITQTTNVVSTTPETDPTNTNRVNKGILERGGDVDVFSFVTGSGSIDLTINPWVVPGGSTRGGNVDLVAELYSDSGALLLSSNPSVSTYARLQTNLNEGSYYLLLRATGSGTPQSASPSGYTAYACVGQYFITGTITPFSGTIAPRAQLVSNDVLAPGSGPTPLQVTYSDDAEILAASLDHNDLRIVGPNGYQRSGRFTGANPSANAPTITGSYVADPPNGATWTASDNGTYNVWMQTNQVADTEGAWVSPGLLGQFTVNVPVIVYAAHMNVDPGWTLDPLWQFGKPAPGESGPSAGFTGDYILGYNLAGDYEPNLPFKYATTPAINCTGASALTLRFKRWLRTRNGDATVVQASTNAVNWTDLWTSTRTVSDSGWTHVQYSLPSWADGATALRIRWGLSSGPSQNETGWNLDDVEIVAGTALDFSPPTATLSADNLTVSKDSPHALRVLYSDHSAVRTSTLDSNDLLVIGPDGATNAVEFGLVDIPADGTPRSATYYFPAPGGTWDVADNGAYQVLLQAGEVTDTFGNGVPQLTLGAFSVSLAEPPPLIVLEPNFIEVPEGGTAQLFLRLSKAPASETIVTVARVSGDPDISIQSGSEIVFTASNWSTPAPVTLLALRDPDQENGTAEFSCSSPGIAPVQFLVVEVDTTPTFYSLTVIPNYPEWGATMPANGTYQAGSLVSVHATPSEFFQFAGWQGDASGAENPLSLTVTRDLSIQAAFSEIFTTNHPTPLWWLAAAGVTNDFDMAVEAPGANGMPLWQSYVAGLNPTNANDRLLLDIQPGLTSAVLTWKTVEGRLYSIERSANLGEAFEPILDAAAFPAGTAALTNTVTPGDQTFYRLRVQKP